MSHNGLRGPIAFCPNCGSDCSHIKWDARSDTNTCLACGWTDGRMSEWQAKMPSMEPLITQYCKDINTKLEDNIVRTVEKAVGFHVDKDRLLQALTDARAFYEEGYRAAMNRPDVVEVVRCKDCAYFAEATVNSKGFLICPAGGMEITDMDFCSYGERRADRAAD